MEKIVAAFGALVLMGLILQDAFEVMLLPRRVERRARFMRFYFEQTWRLWSKLGRRAAIGPARERFLGAYGALSMVVLFVIWMTGLIFAFATIEWAVERPPASFAAELYMSGVTFFTLGFGDVVPHAGGARAVSVLEAGIGFGLIAVVIGYLPVLYQLFSRREAHVIRLDARAGSPPTAVAMLLRHAECGDVERLDDLLRDWEVWSAEMLESHLSYPMLVYYRSQHDNQSWLAALTAIMDACALILVGVQDMRPLQARMTLTMARQVVVEMARALGVEPSRYDGGDRLPIETYDRLEAALADAGVRWAGGDAARETLAALRATYEPLLDGIGARLLLPLPEWMPVGGDTDQWERGHRGTIARRLIDQLSTRGPLDHVAPAGPTSFSQRLRARLRQR